MNCHHEIKSLPDSLWAASASEASLTTVLADNRDAPVVIIGGGFTGLSTALHLAELGIKATVLEANDIGYGGSGRNVGLVNAGLWVKPSVVEAQLGPLYGRRLNTVLATAPEQVFSIIEKYQINCEPVRNGTLHLSHSASGDKALKAKYAELIERDAPISLYTQEEAYQATGAATFRTALFDPRAGTIQPLSYARGLAKAAQSLGADIFSHSPVCELRSTASQHWEVVTPKGKVTAEKVVIATNAYSDTTFKALQQSFIPLHYFQYATHPLDPDSLNNILPNKQGCWDTRQAMSSFRLDNAGRLIIGSIGKIEQHNAFLEGWGSYYLSQLFPKIFDRHTINKQPDFWSHGWSGTIALSNNNLPHLYHLEPGVLACIGYSGRGIAPGTVLGKALAEHLAGMPIEDMPLPVSQRKAMFARNIKEHFYNTGSNLYHLYQKTF